MANIKQIGMAAGTFSVALGIGFVMQNGDALASRFGADNAAPQQPAPFTAEVAEEAPVVQASLEVAAEGASQQTIDVSPEQAEAMQVAFAGAMAIHGDDLAELAALEAEESLPIMPPEATTEELAGADVAPEALIVPDAPEAPVQLAHADSEVMPDIELGTTVDAAVTAEVDCVPTMIAVPGAAASVALAVSAPCHQNVSFTIHHQGMMFSVMTDDNGIAKLTVPALAEVAVMIAAFEDGDGAVATTAVPDFADYDRAVLQWQGDTSVMLSAYEGDAEYGDQNHIHATNPGDVARIEAAEGGYLMRLGDESAADGLMAEVYIFPTGTIGEGPDVMLVAEAEITADNCGQELNAQSIQVSPTGETSALDLTMVMPECDAVGDFLILQNMFEDLTLASR